MRAKGREELSLRLSEEIDSTIWSPQHVQLGSYGVEIGVRYIEVQEGKITVDLFE